MKTVSKLDEYLFDLNGYLIVKNASKGKVSSVNVKVPRFTTGDTKIFDKTLLVTKVEDLACAVGFYKE